MRCLAVADIHYSLPQFDWIVRMAERFDVVVLAGDHLDVGSLVDLRAQAVVVRKYMDLLKERTRLIVSSGNHDLDTRNEDGEKIARWLGDLGNNGIATDCGSFAFGDVLFTICPWWDGPVARERIGEQLAKDVVRRPRRWVWVYHAPPDQSPTSWGGKRHFGDQALLAWIDQYQPDIVLCGHVHQSPFVKEGSWVDKRGVTWIFNAGHQFGVPPAHIVFDTEKDEAVWMSAAGIQAVNFAEPLLRPLPRLPAPPPWFTSRDPVADPSPARNPLPSDK